MPPPPPALGRMSPAPRPAAVGLVAAAVLAAWLLAAGAAVPAVPAGAGSLTGGAADAASPSGLAAPQDAAAPGNGATGTPTPGRTPTPTPAQASSEAPAPFLPPSEIVALVVAGLGAGVLGGLLGIGGSVIMIPVLTLGFRHDQHLSQAAAMIVNVVVAVAAFSQHRRRGAVPWPIVRRMIPAALLAIVAGVAASNVLEGTALKRVFGAFLVVVVTMEVMRLVRVRRARGDAAAAGTGTASAPAAGAGGDGGAEPPARTPGVVAVGFVAIVTGFAAGLLGVGGGTIAVPLCQRVLGLPLRWCIGTSATLMCLTAPVGALVKNATLGRVPGDAGGPLESLAIAGVLTPTAILGSLIGARLTHVLPVPWVRAILVFLLTWAALEFLGVT